MKLAALAVLSISSHLLAQAPPAVFPSAGFAITPPESPLPRAGSQVVAIFNLPAEGGFAPNVYVMATKGHADIASFISVTKKEFESAKAEIIAEKILDAATWQVEYRATLSAKVLRFYARAAIKDGTVYVATATAPEATLEKVAAALKASVDSLQPK